MKCREFQILLSSFAQLCNSGTQGTGASRLQAIGDLLALAPDKAVIATTKQITAFKSGIKTSDHPITLAGDVSQFLRTYGKPAVAKDAAALAELLRGLDEPGIHKLIEHARESFKPKAPKKGKKDNLPIRDDVVAKYIRRLEEALGDDPGFKAIMAEIEMDTSLTAGELSALSKTFSLKPAKSKAAALKNIVARHQNLMTSRAKAAATAGRIAG